MSDLERAISLIISSFSKYADKEGDKHTLSKAELKDLLQNELGTLLGKAPDKTAVDKIFKELDHNQDNSVDFKEFGCFIFTLTIMCHEYFCKK